MNIDFSTLGQLINTGSQLLNGGQQQQPQQVVYMPQPHMQPLQASQPVAIGGDYPEDREPEFVADISEHVEIMGGDIDTNDAPYGAGIPGVDQVLRYVNNKFNQVTRSARNMITGESRQLRAQINKVSRYASTNSTRISQLNGKWSNLNNRLNRLEQKKSSGGAGGLMGAMGDEDSWWGVILSWAQSAPGIRALNILETQNHADVLTATKTLFAKAEAIVKAYGSGVTTKAGAISLPTLTAAPGGVDTVASNALKIDELKTRDDAMHAEINNLRADFYSFIEELAKAKGVSAVDAYAALLQGDSLTNFAKITPHQLANRDKAIGEAIMKMVLNNPANNLLSSSGGFSVSLSV